MLTTASISFDLAPRERLLWSGVPRQGVFLRTQDAMLIPFSLLWGGFAIFWEYRVMRTGAPLMFRLWGIPFVLVGLYLIVGRFFFDAVRRRRTAYGLTTDRVIISSRMPTASVKSLSLRTLTDIQLDERPDGTGTISFGPRLPYARWTGGSAWPGVPTDRAFEMIPDARRVFEMIQSAQRDSGASAK